MRRIAEGIALAHDLAVSVIYSREFLPLVNDLSCTDALLAAAGMVVSAARLRPMPTPSTASEDFAHFLAHVPGCFAFICNGTDSTPLHNPDFDFNDVILTDGARLHAAIARRRLVVDFHPELIRVGA